MLLGDNRPTEWKSGLKQRWRGGTFRIRCAQYSPGGFFVRRANMPGFVDANVSKKGTYRGLLG